MRAPLIRTVGCGVALAAVLVLGGCWSSANEINYDGPRDELVDACGRAVFGSQLIVPTPGKLIVENVTVFDSEARYPIVFGELEAGSERRYQWMCEIPHGDDYLAAEITSLVPMDERTPETR